LVSSIIMMGHIIVIKFQTSEKGVVVSGQCPVASIKIYDISGRVVKSFNLATCYSLLATSVVWDGKDDSGRKLPVGVYFVRLETGDFKQIEKVILLK